MCGCLDMCGCMAATTEQHINNIRVTLLEPLFQGASCVWWKLYNLDGPCTSWANGCETSRSNGINQHPTHLTNHSIFILCCQYMEYRLPVKSMLYFVFCQTGITHTNCWLMMHVAQSLRPCQATTHKALLDSWGACLQASCETHWYGTSWVPSQTKQLSWP